MNYTLPRSLLAAAACACLCGCLNLKPARHTARFFVLSPLTAGAATNFTHLQVGLGQVKLPGYLFNTSLAVRKGTNEVEYLQNALWAEQMPSAFQRVLAANLAVLLPSDQVRLSSWRQEDVNMEVHVTVEQFDVDTSGHGVLVAWWRILSPGGDKLLKSGRFQTSHHGPSPQSNPEEATATLSGLLADLSRELAEAMKALPSRRAAQH